MLRITNHRAGSSRSTGTAAPPPTTVIHSHTDSPRPSHHMDSPSHRPIPSHRGQPQQESPIPSRALPSVLRPSVLALAQRPPAQPTFLNPPGIPALNPRESRPEPAAGKPPLNPPGIPALNPPPPNPPPRKPPPPNPPPNPPPPLKPPPPLPRRRLIRHQRKSRCDDCHATQDGQHSLAHCTLLRVGRFALPSGRTLTASNSNGQCDPPRTSTRRAVTHLPAAPITLALCSRSCVGARQ